MSYNRHLDEKPIFSLDQFQLIQEEWLKVYEAASAKSPFLSFEFVNLWYSCFARPNQVRIYHVSDRGQTIGFLPLVLKREHGVKVLSSLTNEHCLHSGPLVRNGWESQFPKMILEALLRDRNSWDLLNYEFTYSFSDIPYVFPQMLLDNSGLRWEINCQPTYTVSLNKSFQEYFNKDLSDKVRKNIKMYKNRLAKEESFRIYNYRGVEAVGSWDEFLRIEDSGWKGEVGSSIRKASPNYRAFYEGLLNLLGNLNALSMFFLEVKGENIAGVFGYIDRDTYHYAKIGYDEQFSALSPSNLLMIHILEHLMTNYPGIKRFHMFPWDHGYKHRYANEESVCIATRIFNRTIFGQGAYFSQLLKERIKKIPGMKAPVRIYRRLLKLGKKDKEK
jgi:CelD/BcsL family acetyltransferase involved in cellulose biosynthesis